MITLEFTEAEARELEGAVTRRVTEMMAELVHTSDRTAHAELRADYDELEKLQKRLRTQTAPATS